MNTNIIKTKNTLIAVLVALNVFFALFLVVLNCFLKQLLADDFDNIILVISIVAVLLFLLIDAVFIFKKILPMLKLASVTPIKCKLEDFVIESYKVDGKVEYKVHPIVRNVITNDLYFTFGDYNLSSYKVVYAAKSSMNVSIRVLRKDKTEVGIGDSALLYIYKPLQVKIEMLEDGKYVKLNNNKILLNPINSSINPGIFNETKFFKGLVEFNRLDFQQ